MCSVPQGRRRVLSLLPGNRSQRASPSGTAVEMTESSRSRLLEEARIGWASASPPNQLRRPERSPFARPRQALTHFVSRDTIVAWRATGGRLDSMPIDGQLTSCSLHAGKGRRIAVEMVALAAGRELCLCTARKDRATGPLTGNL